MLVAFSSKNFTSPFRHSTVCMYKTCIGTRARDRMCLASQKAVIEATCSALARGVSPLVAVCVKRAQSRMLSGEFTPCTSLYPCRIQPSCGSVGLVVSRPMFADILRLGTALCGMVTNLKSQCRARRAGCIERCLSGSTVSSTVARLQHAARAKPRPGTDARRDGTPSF